MPLRKRIKEIVETRVRYGYRRIHVLLRREGWAVNVKRVHRLYRLEMLYETCARMGVDMGAVCWFYGLSEEESSEWHSVLLGRSDLVLRVASGQLLRSTR